MNTRTIIIISFVSSIFFIPIVDACYIINFLGVGSCSILYDCYCANNGYCRFYGVSSNPDPSVPNFPYGICDISWITYDGPKPAYYWDNYPNAYGSSYATNVNNGYNPIPPSNYNGKPCEVRWAQCTRWPICVCIPYTDCWSGLFEGVWDYSERACSGCNGKIEERIHFGVGGEQSRNRCETACGTTDIRCDEIPPGGSGCIGKIKRTCDSNCNFVSDKDCRDFGSEYFCSDGNCVRRFSRGGGGGCGGTPMNRCIHLGDYEFPFYILIILVVIMVTIFGVFKFFVKK